MANLIDRAASSFGVMTPKVAATVVAVAAAVAVIMAMPYVTVWSVPALAIWKSGQRTGEFAVIWSPMANIFAAITSVFSVCTRDSDISFVQFANVAVMVAGLGLVLMTVEMTAVWAESFVNGLSKQQREFETFMFVSLGATLASYIAAIHVRIGARARVAAISAAAATVKKAE